MHQVMQPAHFQLALLLSFLRITWLWLVWQHHQSCCLSLWISCRFHLLCTL